MTALYVLDTDHLTLLQRNHRAVITRFTALPPEVIAATIVSAMEQVRGRLAQIHRAKTASEVVRIGISKGLSAGTSGARLRSTSAPPACATLPWVVHARARHGAATLCGHPGARAGAAQRCSCWGWTRAGWERGGPSGVPWNAGFGKGSQGRPGLYSACRAAAGIRSTGLEGHQPCCNATRRPWPPR